LKTKNKEGRKMKTNKPYLILVLIMVGLFLSGIEAFPQQTADQLYEKTLYLEEAKGEMQQAIDLYQEIIKQYPGNRQVVAKSLLHAGFCYEKLGLKEAQQIYRRIINDYSENKDEVLAARTRLAMIDQVLNPADQLTMVVRLVWKGGEGGAVSSDGSYFAFTDWDTGDLTTYELATGKKRHVTNKGSWSESDEQAEGCVISPEGKQIAYSWYNRDGLYDFRIIGKDGSDPRVLYHSDEMDFIVPSDWSSDGKHILAAVYRKDKSVQIALISVPDGTVRVLKTMEWYHPGGKMIFSPDGRYIVYDMSEKGNPNKRDIIIMDADGSREIPLVKHPADDNLLGWTPDGKRVLFSSDRTGIMSAWAIQVADGKLQGAPEVIKMDIGRMEPIGFTRDGSFYYSLGTSMIDVLSFTYDPVSGKVIDQPAPIIQRIVGSTEDPVWSPDGRFLAYILRPNVTYGFSPSTLVIHTLENGEEREISPSLSAFSDLRWSSDGRFILAWGIDKKGQYGIYRIDVQTGAILPIVKGQVNHPVWSSDGKMILYVSEQTILTHDLETNEEKQLFKPVGKISPANLVISPDGRQLAFSLSGAVPETSLMVMPTAGGSPREILQLKDPESIRAGWHGNIEWIADGHQILFVKAQKDGNNELWQIPVEGGKPQNLGITNQGIISGLRVHPDGRRVAFTSAKLGGDVWVIENFVPKTEPKK
jgi:Tol biopolymer transport system component